MAGVRAALGRVARAGSRPARGYVNRHVEALKDEVRQRAATERAAAEFDLHNVRVAIDRLEEAIGFLGMQLTVVRSLLEDDRPRPIVVLEDDRPRPIVVLEDDRPRPIVVLEDGAEESVVVADEGNSVDVARALTALGYERATGTVWTRTGARVGASDPPS